jgi:hypothetical protein
MKIQDAGMILEEQPAKVAEAVKLFLQGARHYLPYVFFFFAIFGKHSNSSESQSLY